MAEMATINAKGGDDGIVYLWDGKVRYMRRERRCPTPRWQDRWLGTAEIMKAAGVCRQTAQKIARAAGGTNAPAAPGGVRGHWRIQAGQLVHYLKIYRPRVAATVARIAGRSD